MERALAAEKIPGVGGLRSEESAGRECRQTRRRGPGLVQRRSNVHDPSPSPMQQCQSILSVACCCVKHWLLAVCYRDNVCRVVALRRCMLPAVLAPVVRLCLPSCLPVSEWHE